MLIRVLLFGAYREWAGAGELGLDVPEGITVADLTETLRARIHGLDRLPARPVVAVNRAYSDSAKVLLEDDEVALLPPVAGG